MLKGFFFQIIILLPYNNFDVVARNLRYVNRIESGILPNKFKSICSLYSNKEIIYAKSKL